MQHHGQSCDRASHWTCCCSRVHSILESLICMPLTFHRAGCRKRYWVVNECHYTGCRTCMACSECVARLAVVLATPNWLSGGLHQADCRAYLPGYDVALVYKIPYRRAPRLAYRVRRASKGILHTNVACA